MTTLTSLFDRRLLRAIAALETILSGLGVVGLLVAMVSNAGDVDLWDITGALALFCFTAWAGVRLWRRGWSGAGPVLLSLLLQLPEASTGGHFYRFGVGPMAWVTLLGTLPHPALQFEVGVSLLGRVEAPGPWLALNLVSLLLTCWLVWGRYRSRSTPVPSS